MHRWLIALVLTLTMGGGAVAAPYLGPTRPKYFSLSPNGRLLFLSETWTGPSSPQKFGRYALIDVNCIEAGRPMTACAAFSSETGVAPIERVVWSSDSRALLALHANGWLALSRRGGAWTPEARPYSFGDQTIPVAPGVLDPAILRRFPDPVSFEAPAAVAFPDKAWLASGLSGVEDPGNAFLDSRGRLIGWQTVGPSTFRVYDRAGGWAELPGVLNQSYLGPRNVEVFARGDGRGLYLWTGSHGDHGSLTLVGGGKATPIALPADARGPLRPVFSASGNQVVGMHDRDRFYRLEGSARLAGDLDASIRAVRDDEPRWELADIRLSETRVFVARFTDIGGHVSIRLFDMAKGRGWIVATDAAPGQPAYGSEPVAVATAWGRLPARLYRTGRPPRGLVVEFHGGPSAAASLDSPVYARRMLDAGFDVLAVDYRGSIGYGAPLYRALRRPAIPIAEADLTDAIAWARSQGAYRQSRIGFYGASFGGAAGAGFVVHDLPGLDFAILDSGFIDAQLNPVKGGCGLGGWQPYVLGFEPLPGGGCKRIPTGLLEVSRPSAMPVLLYVGERDRQARPDISQVWFGRVKAAGGCPELLFQAEGPHTTAQLAGEVDRRFTEALAA